MKPVLCGKEKLKIFKHRLVPRDITNVLQSHVKKLSKTQLQVGFFNSNKNPPGETDVW